MVRTMWDVHGVITSSMGRDDRRGRHERGMTMEEMRDGPDHVGCAWGDHE